MGNMNINNSIAQYVQNSGKDVSEVTESLERVRENLTSGSSVFNVGDNATAEQFGDYMSQFVDDGNCKDCYAEDVEVLFNVLDVDGDGVLSSEEMKVIQQSNKGVVNEFGVWNSLYDLDVDKINEEIAKNTSNPSTGSGNDTNVGTSNPTQPENVISDDEAASYAKQLFDAMDGWGTDEDTVNNILNDQNLSDDDLVKIMKIYNEQYGSLIQDIEGDFSWMSGQKDVMSAMADRLVGAAENGNQDAINLLCKEFRNGTAEMTGTADEFIERIMDTASDDVLAQMVANYADVNDGADILKDVKEDFSGKTEDKYLDRLSIASTNAEYEDKTVAGILVDGAVDTAKTAIKGGADAVSIIVEGAGDTVKELLEGDIAGAAGEVVETVTDTVKNAWETTTDVVGETWDTVKDVWYEIWH